MPKIKRLIARTALACTFLTASLTSPAVAQEATPQQARPNFLVIVADDLGWSDLGAFGGEISTPNLDRLALSGLRLAGFHTAPTCSPTRAMLMSGTDNHRAGLGTMAEAIVPNQQGKPGYEGYLRADVAALPERLQAAGYRTLLSGKWHLGLRPEQDPHARGFEHSFALLQGAHNHFGFGLAQDPAKGSTYTENGRVVSSLPTDFYSSDYFATKLISQLQASREGDGGKRPFFAYLAFTAPHWPLQAPAADVAKYRGRFDQGFEVLRQQRLKRQQELGLVAPGTVAATPTLPSGDWNSLNPEQRQTAARDMEVYAAMVDRLDQNVGRVIEELRRSGELDNTVIVFLADNGAEGLDPATTGARMLAPRLARADNSLDNRGNANSYVVYGPGWAQAATAPSWKIKGYATEGGTRAVSFVSWKGLAQPGGVSKAFLSVSDIAPTLLELAGAPSSGDSFAGKTVRPITGRSWVPYLTGRAGHVYGPQDAFGSELFGSRALRQGDWKITDIGDGQWRLFNIAGDPGETNDLASAQPERLKQLVAAWDAYARDVGVILPESVQYRP